MLMIVPPRFRLAICAALTILATGAAQATPATPPARMRSLIVYGNDACPKADGDEIVVCAHEPESERYRIPKKLRDKKKEDEPGARSWTDRVAGVEEASRPSRPNSCSAVGASGQTGCTQAMLRQWFAERREAKAEATEIP